jgi:GPH family glycoside/pentoside/hexuronide:cation symporter
MTELKSTKLPLKTKLGFGVCDLGGNLFFTAISFVLLNFMTDTVGLSAGLAGTALMIGRLWDAFYDPIIGYASDRTRTSFGRRRPFMLAGAIPMFIAMVLIFTNPSIYIPGISGNQTSLFIWALIVFIVLSTAYSTVNIPYSSLTPELTQDFNERTSLNGYRFGFAVIGTLMGAGAALPIVNAFPDKTTGSMVMGIIFGSAMLITALITVFTIKEPETKPAQSMNFIKTYLAVFKNKPFLFILGAYVFHIMSITTVSGILIYFFKYIMGNEGQTTIALLILLVTAMLFIPVSVVLAKKIGKKSVYGAGMLIIAFICMVLFFFAHTMDVTFTFGMMFLAGVGMGFTYAMPYAILPDAIEYDYLLTGERREGSYYGIWTWALKIGQALSVFLMGWILSISGYIPNLMAQSESAKLGIRIFLGPVPAAIFVLGALILYFYPIDEKKYEEIVADIKKMEAGKK